MYCAQRSPTIRTRGTAMGIGAAITGGTVSRMGFRVSFSGQDSTTGLAATAACVNNVVKTTSRYSLVISLAFIQSAVRFVSDNISTCYKHSEILGAQYLTPMQPELIAHFENG